MYLIVFCCYCWCQYCCCYIAVIGVIDIFADDYVVAGVNTVVVTLLSMMLLLLMMGSYLW